MTTKKLLGEFVRFDSLSELERGLVQEAWSATRHAYTPRSQFPVGSAVLARNAAGERKQFCGCNVEGRFLSQSICAERNAVTTAIAQGYSDLLFATLVLAKYQGPGASPCGECRQVLVEFGANCTMLDVTDDRNNVRRFAVRDLLPAATGDLLEPDQLNTAESRLVRRILRSKSGYVPYSRAPQAAVFAATNASGKRRDFLGLPDDNSAYGASALAGCVAMRAARTAGYDRDALLALTVADPKSMNPVDGGCLQVLREFGASSKLLLVDSSGRFVRTNVDELLPESFGPESLS